MSGCGAPAARGKLHRPDGRDRPGIEVTAMRTPRAHTPRAQLPDDETSRDVEPAETPDVQGAFPRLSAEQISALESAGTRRATHVGDVLFREGDLTCDFVVVVWGTVAIVEDYGGDEERVIGVHGPGRFLGELN